MCELSCRVRRKQNERKFQARTEGQTMSPTGPSPFIKGIFPSSSSASMMAGREKASVFPDPVKAIPIMSRPEKLSVRKKRWMCQYRDSLSRAARSLVDRDETRRETKRLTLLGFPGSESAKV